MKHTKDNRNTKATRDTKDAENIAIINSLNKGLRERFDGLCEKKGKKNAAIANGISLSCSDDASPTLISGKIIYNWRSPQIATPIPSYYLVGIAEYFEVTIDYLLTGKESSLNDCLSKLDKADIAGFCRVSNHLSKIWK